jgi:hypothetical protein
MTERRRADLVRINRQFAKQFARDLRLMPDARWFPPPPPPAPKPDRSSPLRRLRKLAKPQAGRAAQKRARAGTAST